ncbi:hypothetical protein ACGF3G_37175 [Streptomyces sp. NPDC048179]|uniref:hypothetical protein n=1 Tax=Streptomyces sp. NPDC048179 TaxID=3365506 RepID=UPI0037236028
MSTYAISYSDRAARRKAGLSAPQLASLDDLEKRLSIDPFGPPAFGSRKNGWSITFAYGLVFYDVADRHAVINAIDLVALCVLTRASAP